VEPGVVPGWLGGGGGGGGPGKATELFILCGGGSGGGGIDDDEVCPVEDGGGGGGGGQEGIFDESLMVERDVSGKDGGGGGGGGIADDICFLSCIEFSPCCVIVDCINFEVGSCCGGGGGGGIGARGLEVFSTASGGSAEDFNGEDGSNAGVDDVVGILVEQVSTDFGTFESEGGDIDTA
jgi:hypothetical protein